MFWAGDIKNPFNLIWFVVFIIINKYIGSFSFEGLFAGCVLTCGIWYDIVVFGYNRYFGSFVSIVKC